MTTTSKNNGDKKMTSKNGVTVKKPKTTLKEEPVNKHPLTFVRKVHIDKGQFIDYLVNAEESEQSKKFKNLETAGETIGDALYNMACYKVHQSVLNVFKLSALNFKKNLEMTNGEDIFNIRKYNNLGFNKMFIFSQLLGEEIAQVFILRAEDEEEFREAIFEEYENSKENILEFFNDNDFKLKKAIEEAKKNAKPTPKAPEDYQDAYYIHQYAQEQGYNMENYPRSINLMLKVAKGQGTRGERERYGQQVNEIVQRGRYEKAQELEEAQERKQRIIEQEDYFLPNLLI